jgi:hypothetical protein
VAAAGATQRCFDWAAAAKLRAWSVGAVVAL